MRRGLPTILNRDMDRPADRLHTTGHTAAGLLGWQLLGRPALGSSGYNTAKPMQVQQPQLYFAWRYIA